MSNWFKNNGIEWCLGFGTHKNNSSEKDSPLNIVFETECKTFKGKQSCKSDSIACNG